ncbi:hypothetical protein Tco_0921868 [Tanacetum coccineum]
MYGPIMSRILVEEDKEEEEIVAEDEAEIIYPYDEAYPNNRPPPALDDESEFAPSVIPVFDAENRPVPPVIHFSSTYELGESSSAREILKDIGEVYPLGPMPPTIGTAIRCIRKLNEQMHGRAKVDKRIVKKIDRSDLRIRMVGRDAMSLDGAIRECQADVSKVNKARDLRVLQIGTRAKVIENQGADDEEVSEGGIPRVIVLGYDGLPLQPVAPPSPDYIPGPENPQTPPVPQDEDEHEFLAEEQPLPGHVTESDPEEDPEEYEDDETEDGPDEDEEDEDEEEEEEEHLTPADSTTVILVDEHVFPPEGIEPVIPPPSTDITIGARITVRPQTSISLPPEAEVERLLTMTTPSPSSPASLSPPSAGERLARIASTQALIDAVTAALPTPPLPPLPPSLYIPPPVDRRDDIPESKQPSRKRLYLSIIGSRYEIEESSTARPTRGRGINYGFVSTVDAEERRQGIRDVGYGIRGVDQAEAVPEIAPMTVGEVNTRVTELAELHERDTRDLYALLEDAQDSRSRISQRVDMDSQWVDLLMGDRMTLQETVWMVEEEAYASREAWAHSIGLSQATHQELQTHRDHVYAHETYLQAHQTQLQLQRGTRDSLSDAAG